MAAAARAAIVSKGLANTCMRFHTLKRLKEEATVLWSSRLEIQGNRVFFNLYESSHEFRS